MRLHLLSFRGAPRTACRLPRSISVHTHTQFTSRYTPHVISYRTNTNTSAVLLAPHSKSNQAAVDAAAEPSMEPTTVSSELIAPTFILDEKGVIISANEFVQREIVSVLTRLLHVAEDGSVQSAAAAEKEEFPFAAWVQLLRSFEILQQYGQEDLVLGDAFMETVKQDMLEREKIAAAQAAEQDNNTNFIKTDPESGGTNAAAAEAAQTQQSSSPSTENNNNNNNNNEAMMSIRYTDILLEQWNILIDGTEEMREARAPVDTDPVVRTLALICRSLFYYYTVQDRTQSFIAFSRLISWNQEYMQRIQFQQQQQQKKVPAAMTPSDPPVVKRKRGRPKKPETIAREQQQQQQQQQLQLKNEKIEKLGEESSGSVEAEAVEEEGEGEEWINPLEQPLTAREEEALVLLSQYLFHAYYHRATLYMNQFKQSAFSLADYDKSIELQPRFESSHLNKGVLYLQLMNDAQRALQQFNHVLTHLNPNNVVALMNRGTLYFKMNRASAALDDFNRVIELDPTNSLAWYSRAKVKSASNPARALEDYNRSIELNPNFAPAYYDRAVIQITVFDQAARALDDFRRASELNPKLAQAHYDMGVIHMNRFEDVSNALECFNRAVELDPDMAVAYNMRGVLKQRYLNQVEEALLDFDHAIRLDAKESKFFASRAILHYEQDNAQQALDDYNSAIELDGKDATMFNNRGVVKAFKLNQPMEALKDFIHAVNLNQSEQEAYFNMGSLYHATFSKFDKALECYNKAVENDPNNPRIYEARAYLYRDRLGRPDLAQPDFDRATMLHQRQQRENEQKKNRVGQ